MNKKKYKVRQWSVVKGQRFRQRGQSIIEVVISIAIAAILAISLISTLLVTQKTSTTSKNTSEANKLAIEYMEQLRIFRDRKGIDALTSVNDVCILNSTSKDPNDWVPYGPPCADVVSLDTTAYTRWFDLVDDGLGRVSVEIRVEWEESSGTKSISHDSILSR